MRMLARFARPAGAAPPDAAELIGDGGYGLHRVRGRTEVPRLGERSPVGDQSLLNIGCRHMGPLADRTMVVHSRELEAADSEAVLVAFAYSSQANGFFVKLSRSSATGRPIRGPSPYDTPANRALFLAIHRHAMSLELSITQVVLGFLLTRSQPTIPIVGPRTIEQLKDTLTAADVVLPKPVFEDLCQQAGF